MLKEVGGHIGEVDGALSQMLEAFSIEVGNAPHEAVIEVRDGHHQHLPIITPSTIHIHTETEKRQLRPPAMVVVVVVLDDGVLLQPRPHLDSHVLLPLLPQDLPCKSSDAPAPFGWSYSFSYWTSHPLSLPWSSMPILVVPPPYRATRLG